MWAPCYSLKPQTHTVQPQIDGVDIRYMAIPRACWGFDCKLGAVRRSCSALLFAEVML